MDHAHDALLQEIRRRLEEARSDPNVTNTDGSNYWGPYVTRAINEREYDGPALVEYIKSVLRKSDESSGWDALLEGERLDISFEEMVLNAVEPIRGLFSDEDREIAARSLSEQWGELEGRHAATELVEVERDRRIVGMVAAQRREEGKPWTAEMEARMIAGRAAKRRASD